MSQLRIAILDDYEGLVVNSQGADRLRSLAEVTALRQHLEGAELVEAVRDFPVLLAIRERTRFTAGLLDKLDQLELLVQSGGHAYHVDEPAATGRGILIALGRRAQAPTRAVPELVFGLVLSLLRDIPQLSAELHASGWPSATGRGLHGRTFGILGLGRHGRPTAALAKAFGCDVVAWGPTLTDDRAEAAGVRRLELDDLLAAADIVSIHLKLSDLSRGLLDSRRLALMKPGAVLINTSRGQIVDEGALVEALAEGRIAGAGLDVFATEPLPEDSALRKLANVVLTPHIGWRVDAVFQEFADIAAEHVAAYVQHQLPRSELVNPAAVQVARPRLGGVAES